MRLLPTLALVCVLLGECFVPPALATETPVYMTVMGDSYTAGEGSTKRCVKRIVFTPIDEAGHCTNYAAVAATLLDRFEPAQYQNLAMTGANTTTVFSDMIPAISPLATHVVLFIGLNELWDFRRYSDAEYSTHLSDWEEMYLTDLAAIKEKVPNARIILANLPNAAYQPFFLIGMESNRLTLEQRQRLSRASVDIDRFLDDQPYDILDTICDRDFYDPATLAPDLQHLNDAGQAHMAERVVEIVRSRKQVQDRMNCAPYSDELVR